MLVNKMSRIMGRPKGWSALVVCVALLTCFSTSSRAVVTTNLTNGGTVNLSRW